MPLHLCVLICQIPSINAGTYCKCVPEYTVNLSAHHSSNNTHKTQENENEELRCVCAVARHGDRTPKQKLKLSITQPGLLDLFHKYAEKKKQAKLKSAPQLQEVCVLLLLFCVVTLITVPNAVCHMPSSTFTNSVRFIPLTYTITLYSYSCWMSCVHSTPAWTPSLKHSEPHRPHHQLPLCLLLQKLNHPARWLHPPLHLHSSSSSSSRQHKQKASRSRRVK